LTYLGQFASSSLNLGKKVGVEVVSNSVVMIGKWSLPNVFEGKGRRCESEIDVYESVVGAEMCGKKSFSRVRGDKSQTTVPSF